MSKEKEGESIVLKPREPFSDMILSQNKDELARFMDQPLTAIAETITGALAAGPQAWTVMTGHIVQGMLKGKLFEHVGGEIKELRDKGKIAEDFAEQKYGFKSWVELLKTIDDEAPDEDKLGALKAMFYAVNKLGIEDSERILNYQLFQIAKELTSGQLLLLKVVFEAYNTRLYAQSEKVLLSGWAQGMADRLGHKVSSLVVRDQVALVNQGLLSARIDISPGAYQPEQHWVDKQNARITDLGIKFCENLKTYELVKVEMDSEEE
jgi:hypothetical protein